MELENIVANTVYLKAREGELTVSAAISREDYFETSIPQTKSSLLFLKCTRNFLSKVALTVTKAKAKSGVKYYNSHTYPNV